MENPDKKPTNPRISVEDVEGLSDALSAMTTAMRNYADAFAKKPDGSPDYSGHQEYHTIQMEESRQRTALYRELRNELIKRGFFGALYVIGALVIYWYASSQGKP